MINEDNIKASKFNANSESTTFRKDNSTIYSNRFERADFAISILFSQIQFSRKLSILEMKCHKIVYGCPLCLIFNASIHHLRRNKWSGD